MAVADTRGEFATMVTRLSTSDSAFYHQENTSTPMYVGSLSILRKPRGGLSYETMLETVERRLPQIPRYRQKVRELTLGLARPVWVDDSEFDITYHVRRSALPSPGSDEQLHELIARMGARPLDRSRPLWEMYLIEGCPEIGWPSTQVAPGAHQRDDGTGDRTRHRRPDPAATAVRRGHLDSRPRAEQRSSGGGRHRGLAGQARRAAADGSFRGYRPTS